jgi:hypothetical protein
VNEYWEQSKDDDVSTIVEAAKSPFKKKYNADKAEARSRLHTRLLSWYTDERHRQSENRQNMAMDEDYYDGKQWDPEDVQHLNERGQPALVLNRIKTPIDWVMGTQKRMPTQFNVLGRNPSDEISASAKFKYMKYLSDVNNDSYNVSKAFESCIIAGIGWLEEGFDPSSESEQIFSRNQWWREMYRDSRDTSDDLEQARYVIRVKYLDIDIAVGMLGEEHRDRLSRGGRTVGADENFWYLGEKLETPHGNNHINGIRQGFMAGGFEDQGRRETVKLIEVRYRNPLPNGKSEIRFALMTETELIFDETSPYKHGRFGFVPVYCYRRKGDNMEYGMIRQSRDPQDDYNKKHSKATHILGTKQVVMDLGAVEDKEELRLEVARPDSIIEVQAGKKLDIIQDKQLAREHLDLMHMAAQNIESGMGVTDENMGRSTNAVSGVAIDGRQQQGHVVVGNVLENLRFANLQRGRIRLSLMEQFVTDEKTFRITETESGKPQYVTLNKRNADGTIEDDIANTQADFIIDEQDWTATARKAQQAQLFDMASKIAGTLPQIATKLALMAVQLGDFPFKDQMLASIFRDMGIPDPTKPVSDEDMVKQQAQKDAQAQIDAKRLTMELDRLGLENAKMRAEIPKIMAEALDKKLEAHFAAIQAGVAIQTNPNVAAIGDALLRSPVETPLQAQAPLSTQPQAQGPINQPPIQAMEPTIDPAQQAQPLTPGVGQNTGINPQGMPNE